MAEELLLELRKFVAPEFVFGRGALSLAGRQAAGLGVRRALVVADPGLAALGVLDRVTASLDAAGVEWRPFTGLTSNPRDFEVMVGARCFLEEGCDALVALGGGSAMDCAKGIGIVAVNGGDVLAFAGVDNVERPGPPLICIPTTAGSGAEVSQFAIVTDPVRKVKVAIASKSLIPDAALVDPDTTVTMDAPLTAATGLDALTHAVEAYVSNAHAPVTDLFAKKAMRLVAANLAAAVAKPGNMKARGAMMLASLYAGLAFSNAILGLVHAMAHSLGGLLDLPHGEINAILLDHVIDFNFEAAPSRYETVGRALGARIPRQAPWDEKKGLVLEAVRSLKRKAGVPAGLGAVGVAPADLPRLAANTLADPCLLTNPRVPTGEELVALYEKACG